MARMLVTGGSGFIGRQVCENATNSGHEVRSVSRSGQPQIDESWTNKVDWISTDLYEPDTWRNQLIGCQTVIHSIGITDESSADGSAFERINGDGAILAALEAERAGVETFVFVSASTKPPRVRDEYIEAKRRAERAISDLDLRIIILRPGPIYGEGNPHFPRLVDRAFRILDRDWLADRLGEARPLPVETVGRATSRVAFDSDVQGVIDIPEIHERGRSGF